MRSGTDRGGVAGRLTRETAALSSAGWLQKARSAFAKVHKGNDHDETCASAKALVQANCCFGNCVSTVLGNAVAGCFRARESCTGRPVSISAHDIAARRRV